jgi:phosphoribosylanthranilate isomerase
MDAVTRVKVCGLTRAEDVRLVLELGAWALGLVLTVSPRQVSAARAAKLVAVAREAAGPTQAGDADERRHAAGLPHAVAVVATESPEWIADALAETGADAVQLSAGADGPAVAATREAAARLGLRPLVIAAADTTDSSGADYMLLDARSSGAYGGTGKALDWEALAANPSTPARDLVLAGGLRPANVGRAVALVHPAAVDVSSGVESEPGRKDHALVREFFAAVEQADRGWAADGAPPAAGATTRRTTG